jgi:hypothetical protein
MATTDTVQIFNLLARRVARAGVRRFRTSKSKHTFSQHDHLTVLVFKSITHASTRTLEMLAPLVLSRSMDHSTPGKAARRLGPALLHRVLVACLPAIRGRIVAIDSTSFSTSTQSPYYTHRFFAHAPIGMVKCSVLVDTRTPAVLAAQIHVMPRHDIRDAARLAQHARGAKHFVADKAYDAEWLHQLLSELEVQPHIPLRARARKGHYRRRHARSFKLRIFHQRPLVETTHSVVKRRWGGAVAAHRAVMIRVEILLKLITHNLTVCLRTLAIWLMMSTELVIRALSTS